MIKEALQYIASLKEEAMGIITEEINGETYIKGQGVRRIENDYCECMALNTLDALTIMIVEAIKGDMLNLPLMVRVTGNTVDVFSAMDRFMKRDHIAQSRPDVPTIRFNRYMPVEEFIIQLQTCFEEDENHNKTKLLAFVSKLSSEVKVEIEDDGISQKVTSSTGTAVKHSESITLPPIVRLKPMNTYPEIDQVETMYLLRVNKDGDVALFEADGGRWRFEAQRRIVEYISARSSYFNLDEGSVSIVG